MNSYLNIFLFIVAIMILLACFVGVNVYINKITLSDVKSYFSHNAPPAVKTLDSVEPTKESVGRWINIFASKKNPDFSYPVSEMLLVLDFSTKSKNGMITISNLDSYKLFCLNEILKNNNIKFAYKKSDTNAILQVALNDNIKKKLIEELDNYDISYQIN